MLTAAPPALPEMLQGLFTSVLGAHELQQLQAVNINTFLSLSSTSIPSAPHTSNSIRFSDLSSVLPRRCSGKKQTQILMKA